MPQSTQVPGSPCYRHLPEDNMPLDHHIMRRYERQIRLEEIGEVGQSKLGDARVLVIGAGGLACPVLQYLAAAGIGQLGVMDGDEVSWSNLHRQVLYAESDLGLNKAIVAAEKLAQQNTLISITPHPYQLSSANARDLFSQYDLVVDCTDNIPARYLINDASIQAGIPLVYAAIHRYEGQVAVFNFKGSTSYRCIHPTPPGENEIPDCATTGVLGVLPGIIGSIQANEVLKILLSIGEPLVDRLLIFDLLSMRSDVFHWTPNKDEIAKAKAISVAETDYGQWCRSENSLEAKEVSAQWLLDHMNSDLLLIDVREPDEWPKLEDLDAINIPMNRIEAEYPIIANQKTTVLMCQSGQRSLKAARLILEKFGEQPVYSLQHGIRELEPLLKNEKA